MFQRRDISSVCVPGKCPILYCRSFTKLLARKVSAYVTSGHDHALTGGRLCTRAGSLPSRHSGGDNENPAPSASIPLLDTIGVSDSMVPEIASVARYQACEHRSFTDGWMLHKLPSSIP